jgi:hypothetical protein
VKEFERRLRVSDLVIKFITVPHRRTLKRWTSGRRIAKRAPEAGGPGPRAAFGGAGDDARRGGKGQKGRIWQNPEVDRAARQRPTGGDKAVATQKQYFRRKRVCLSVSEN